LASCMMQPPPCAPAGLLHYSIYRHAWRSKLKGSWGHLIITVIFAFEHTAPVGAQLTYVTTPVWRGHPMGQVGAWQDSCILCDGPFHRHALPCEQAATCVLQ
jgi:hypothetical protein